MISRCYKWHMKTRYKSYEDCFVCDEWHNFQNFAEWFERSNYQEGMELDKDLIEFGNRIYQPTKCTFIPQEINKIILDNSFYRGDNPIGVCYHKPSGKFVANVRTNEKTVKYLGLFETREEAFRSYKIEKEKFIKSVALKYKDIIDIRVYNSLMSYIVKP